MLTAVDAAGNQELARRFVLYDNETSGISVNEDHPFRVTSATEDTGFQWITDAHGVRTSINVQWEGHFENALHHRRGYLNAIGDHRSGFVENGEKLSRFKSFLNKLWEIGHLNQNLGFLDTIGLCVPCLNKDFQ